MHNQRGAALLITLVLIAVIGSVAFSAGRLALSNFRQVAHLEDSLNAYTAASSGIEDALLRWRFDKNTQTPSGCTGSSQIPTDETILVTRVTLNATSQPVSNCFNPTSQSSQPDPSSIAYDLKIFHRLAPGVAEIVETSGATPALRQDQAAEYDISDLSASITVHWDAATTTNPPSQVRLEVSSIATDGSIVDKDLVASGNSRVIRTNNNASLLRLRPYGADVDNYTITGAPTDSLSSRFTVMESTGYFGDAKRKLKLRLDRLSGSILEQYDFVLFSGSGSVVAPLGT